MKRLFLSVILLLAALIPQCSGASLAYSTYLRYGFKPAAITSDAQGNLYLAGSAVIDPLSRATSAVIAKLNPTATQYLYFEYFDSAASDTITAITVDAAGNLYVTGFTTNPNFPLAGATSLGTLPSGPNDERAFVTKFGPTGVVIFSNLIGGSISSSGMGIALTPQGQILVSGISNAAGFAATPGAFSVSNTSGQWFLVELDPTASKVIFSATGIGGSSIAFDSTGNIFLAGSTIATNYPTTAGAYQTTFVQGAVCYGLCQSGFPGQLQHLTKVNSTGTTLIYSTGLNDPSGGAGNTMNTGLAVDAAGNAYVTGTLFEARYPFTTSDPLGVDGGVSNRGFLSKIDPTGSTLVFSVPVGGAGVALDSSGDIYTAGTVSTYAPIGFPGLTPPIAITLTGALSGIPTQCVPNSVTATEAAYLLKLDAAGNVLDAQWIDGSSVTASAVTLIGTKLWTTGVSADADVPFTPGALADTNLVPGPLAGAFLSAADFSVHPAASGPLPVPVISCVLDAGNMMHAGPVAPYQILSIFGANLGPATGVLAPDGTDPSIAGVTVTFDGNPAKMTYVSSSQINVMVPGPQFTGVDALPQSTVMQVSVNGVPIQRESAWTAYNLNLFTNLGLIPGNCAGSSFTPAFQPVVLNPDGSVNSCTNPAKFGSVVTFFAHGVGTNQFGLSMPTTVTGIEAQAGVCGVNVPSVTLSGVVYQVNVQLPATLLPCAQTYSGNAVNALYMTFTYNGMPVGPLVINSDPPTTTPVRSQQIRVWATQ
jgi:uncharacterized protein (TIGR03437 family)